LIFANNIKQLFVKVRKMDLEDIKKYWIKSADETLKTAINLFENKRYSHSMFFLHLTVEKTEGLLKWLQSQMK